MNLELLRCISMFLIVLSHFAGHGILFQLNYDIGGYEIIRNINTSIAQFFVFGGNIGVAIFIMMMGYFSLHKNFSFKRILDISLIIWFYSISIFVITAIVDSSVLNIENIVLSFFPLLSSSYWFMTAYLITYFLSPYYNKLILSLNKIQLRKLIIFLSILIMFFPVFGSLDMNHPYSPLFFFLYLIGSWIRLYEREMPLKRVGKVSFISGLSITLISILIFNGLAIFTNMNFFHFFIWRLFSNFSLPVMMIAFGLFTWFLSVKKEISTKITFISSTTLAIYLIHDNFLMRRYLWGTLLRLYLSINFNFFRFIISAIFYSSVIFFLCVLVEQLRRKISSLLPLSQELSIKIINFLSKERPYIFRIKKRIKNLWIS